MNEPGPSTYTATPSRRVKLANATEQGAWLQCLAAASSIASGENSPSWVLGMADQFFLEFRARCER